MKAAIATVALLFLALSCTSDAVQVHENGFSFSLEGVKRLQELTGNYYSAGQQRFRASTISLCADPMLPQEFLPLCKEKGASESLARLALVPIDVCEICAFAACAGC
ncbi:unnamed protein product [Ophioblennius macclurei]